MLFITGLMLAMVASLTQRTLQTLGFLKEKGESTQSATLGCERLCSEMREMIQAPTITAGTGIKFFKANPNTAPALGNDFVNVDPHLWTRLYQGANRVEISYQTNGDRQLERRVNGGAPGLVATEVNDISVIPGAVTGNYEVRLSIQERKRVVVFVNAVHCPGVPR